MASSFLCLFLLHVPEGCAIPSVKGMIPCQHRRKFWAMLQAHEGETFYTAKGLPFHYLDPRQGAVEPQNKSITISTVANALARIKARGGRRGVGQSPAPKKIGCYGASYLTRCFYNWAFSSICRRQTTNHCNKLQAHNRLHNPCYALLHVLYKIGQNE